MMENDHQEIKVIASPEEHKLITTNPDELAALQANIPVDTPVEKRKLLINLDLSKGFYKKSALSPEEIDYLLKNDYVQSSHVPLHSRNYADFLVKRVGEHTSEHTFLLHATYEEVLRHTNKVRTDETARTDGINPDVVFTNAQGEEIALEIETGSNLKHHPRYLERKVAKLNELYPARWRFVLTSAHSRRKYETAFSVPTLLRHQVPHFVKWHFSRRGKQDNVTKNWVSRNIDDKKEADRQFKKVTSSSQRR